MSIGGTGVATLTITRGGSFTGTVSLSVSGLPAGVTGTFVPASLDASTSASILTLTAATTAVAGTATLTISASGTGVGTQTASVQLTITQPTIALTASPATLSIAAGQSGISTITITRSAGYTGAVTLTLDSPPAGITASFNTSPTQGASSTLTLSIAASVAVGSHTVTVKGTAPGAQDKTVVIAVTVTVGLQVGFTIAVDPVEMELPAGNGWTANGIVSIQRTNGFAGTVNVSVSSLGVSAFIAASPSTIATTETATNILGLTIAGGAPGVYSGTVRVTAAGFAEQTAQVRLRISLPSTGAITWKFCNASRVPRFFAVRDGNGTWQHIVPAGPSAATAATPTTFSFSITQPTASVAMVNLGEKTSASPLIQGHHWIVYYMTAQEIIQQAAEECVRYPDATTRTSSTTVTGYQSFDAVVPTASQYALASIGSTGPLTTSLAVSNLQPGPFDLLTTRSNFSGGGGAPIVVQSLVLQRGLDPASAGTTPAINFATAGVAPAVGTVTYGNTSGELFYTANTFMTASGLNGLFAATGTYAQTNRAWYGVPTSKQIAGDLHQVVATTNNVAGRRAVIAYARDVSTRALDFGPVLSTPTVTAGSGGASPWIVRATGTLAADYLARASMYLRENIPDPRTMVIVATRGWLGSGSSYDVPVPDLSTANAFTAFWNFRRGAPVKWTVTGGEGDSGGPNEVFCMFNGICPVKGLDGAVYKSAQGTGTVTIP
jgi:hypothetical protein